MFTLRTLRVSAAAAAALIAVGTVGAAPAMAKPTKPGAVSITSASAAEPAIGTYDVDVQWSAATNASSYEATISRSGTVLKSTTVTSTTWSTSVAGTPGQQLTISVRGLAGRFKGKWATKNLALSDQIAPTGTYRSTFDSNAGTARITEDSIRDDSPVSQVTRTVDWGDGSAPEAWPTGGTIDHQYPLVEKRYVPTVTLRDTHGHSSTQNSTGVVVLDDTAPTGSFSAGPSTAWAAFTTVTLTQNGALYDNWTPADQITRSVAWGDGTTSDWTTGTTLTHVYAAAGTYQPKVTITDEAQNAAVEPTSDVVVTADTTGPKLKLTLPKAKQSVKAWKTLRGKATDSQTGVKSVWLKAVEKRGATWFGYNAVTHKWVKTTSKAKAFKKAKAFTRTTNAQHQWTAKLAKLRKGTLIYKVRATDQVKNPSLTVTKKATLTKA